MSAAAGFDWAGHRSGDYVPWDAGQGGPDPEQAVIAKRQKKIDRQKVSRKSVWLNAAIDELPAMDAYLITRHHIDGMDLGAGRNSTQAIVAAAERDREAIEEDVDER